MNATDQYMTLSTMRSRVHSVREEPAKQGKMARTLYPGIFCWCHRTIFRKSGLTVDSPNLAMSGKTSCGADGSMGSACGRLSGALTMTSLSSWPICRDLPPCWSRASIPDLDDAMLHWLDALCWMHCTVLHSIHCAAIRSRTRI
jgi:hypothetical protein